MRYARGSQNQDLHGRLRAIAAGPMHGIQLPATDACDCLALYMGDCDILYSPGDALNAILNYWVEELRMNYVALAIALG